MPKIKTKSALKKRVKVSSTGKVKRGNAYRSHLAHSKTTKQKRHSKKGSQMHQTDLKRLKGLHKGI